MVSDRKIGSVVIVGGGTAGWMAAASLVKFLENLKVTVRLVESAQIATVGVGEATIPPIIDFLRQLGVDETDIVREIKATFKLGIAFRDWTRPGDFYFHPFAPTGTGIGSVSFPTYWLKMFLEGKAGRLEDYSIQARAAVLGKFTKPQHAPNTPLNKITYGLHFDAVLFARYLRRFAEERGVERIEGNVTGVSLRTEDGFIELVKLDNGQVLQGDLFIDCSGFQGVLIEKALQTGYDDWSHWLPCDRAFAVPTERLDPLPCYTLATARDMGWQWCIPLQHRVGNGYVFSSGFIGDDEARRTLMANLGGAPLADPVRLAFTPGKRRKTWNRNCLALGLAAGFLEPLEATSIHLIQRGIAMLLKFFPDRNFEQADIDRYNRTVELDFARARDFLLLHYRQTERLGPFWDHCRAMPLTDTLKERIELFRSHGRILRDETEFFPIQSWLSVMIGQNVMPRSYDPLADTIDPTKIEESLEEMRLAIVRCADAMPTHLEFIERNVGSTR